MVGVSFTFCLCVCGKNPLRKDHLDLVTRTEMAHDRRRKRISPTAKARALLERVRKARSAEYGAALSVLAPKLRVELARTVQRILRELPAEGNRSAA